MFVIGDVETTGVSDLTSRITELALIRVDLDNPENDEVILHTYLNPEESISQEITELTGISDETVRDAPVFSDVAPIVFDVVDQMTVFAGYNPWFDQRMINAESRRLNRKLEWPRLVCCKRLWDIHEPRDSRHLTNAFKRFVDPAGFEGAHGALADTRATLDVLRAQLSEFGLADKPVEEWDPEQAVWWGPSQHVVWCEGELRINFGKHEGTPCHKIDFGYWRWISNSDFPTHVVELAFFIMQWDKQSPSPLRAEDVATWAYGKYS